MNDQPNRNFALTINADELLKPDAVEPVEKACNTCHDEGWITLTVSGPVRAVCPFCNKDGHRVSIDTDLAMQLSKPVEREGGEALCECGHAPNIHDPCCVPACGCDGFEPRKPSIEEVFKAAMREIRDLAQDALGYEQICSPVQAVRRLALELAQAKEWENMYADQRERREQAEAQLAEAKRLWEVADGDRVASRKIAKESAQRAEKAEKERDKVLWRAEIAEGERDEAITRAEAAERRAESAKEAITGYKRNVEYLEAKWDEFSSRATAAEARAADLERVLTNVEAYMASESGPLYHLWENCDIGDYDDYQTEWEQTLFDLRDWKNGCVPAASVGGGTEWPEVLLYREVLAALNPDKREEGEADNA